MQDIAPVVCITTFEFIENSYLILASHYIALWDLTQKANEIVMNTHIMHFQCLAHVGIPMTSLAVLLMLRSPNMTAMGK